MFYEGLFLLHELFGLRALFAFEPFPLFLFAFFLPFFFFLPPHKLLLEGLFQLPSIREFVLDGLNLLEDGLLDIIGGLAQFTEGLSQGFGEIRKLLRADLYEGEGRDDQ